MEPSDIRPEPDEAGRQAILGALAAEEVERPAIYGWAEALLPVRGGSEEEP
jgi:hypothetical protein